MENGWDDHVGKVTASPMLDIELIRGRRMEIV